MSCQIALRMPLLAEIVPLLPAASTSGACSAPPSQSNVPVTVSGPPVIDVPQNIGGCEIDRSTSVTLGTLSTAAAQCVASGGAITTESPSPGTPPGLQLRESVQEWLSACGSWDDPTQT